MKGKEICRYLKNIRRQIAESNHIALDIPECTFEGECRGTCPRCEAEVGFLERALAQKSGWQQALSVVGVATGLAVGTIGCSPQTPGEVSVPEPRQTPVTHDVSAFTGSLPADSTQTPIAEDFDVKEQGVIEWPILLGEVPFIETDGEISEDSLRTNSDTMAAPADTSSGQ